MAGIFGSLVNGGDNSFNFGVGSGNVPTQVGTDRDYFAGWSNATNIAKEDYDRQMEQMKYSNENAALEAQKQRDWSSAEAQKQRDYDERMIKEYYVNMVEGMKKAGINPILAFQNGVSQMPSAHGYAATGGASSGSYTSSYKGYVSDTQSLAYMINGIMQIAAGLYTANLNSKTTILSSLLRRK